MVVVMVVVAAAAAAILINHSLNVEEPLHVARDSDSTFLIKPKLFLGLLQQQHEERVIQVHHRHHHSLLLLPLPHLYRHTPFRHISQLLLFLFWPVN